LVLGVEDEDEAEVLEVGVEGMLVLVGSSSSFSFVLVVEGSTVGVGFDSVGVLSVESIPVEVVPVDVESAEFEEVVVTVLDVDVDANGELELEP
jgi:hypothetical protein